MTHWQTMDSDLVPSSSQRGSKRKRDGDDNHDFSDNPTTSPTAQLPLPANSPTRVFLSARALSALAVVVDAVAADAVDTLRAIEEAEALDRVSADTLTLVAAVLKVAEDHNMDGYPSLTVGLDTVRAGPKYLVPAIFFTLAHYSCHNSNTLQLEDYLNPMFDAAKVDCDAVTVMLTKRGFEVRANPKAFRAGKFEHSWLPIWDLLWRKKGERDLSVSTADWTLHPPVGPLATEFQSLTSVESHILN